MNQQIIWKPVNHPDILPGYLISPQGYIKSEGIDDKDAIKEPSYHSTNGYDFMLLNNKDGKVQLFPIDDIIAMAYIPIPESLKGKNVKVSHINGDTRDISLDNLQWVEDIEEWKACTYPGVKPDMYEVSSWGRVRNIPKDIIYSSRSTNDRGYNTILLLNGKNNKYSLVTHRLICWEFCIKICETFNEVNHIDGVKTHNIPKNLEWIDHNMNMRHAHNLNMIQYMKGSDLSFSKIDEDTVNKICDEFIKNWGNSYNVYKTMRSLNFDVTLKEIQHIKHKECWSWISDKYWSNNDLLELHIKKINLICETLVSNNMDVNKTLDKLSITIPYLTKRFIQIIKYKESYVDISDKYFK